MKNDDELQRRLEKVSSGVLGGLSLKPLSLMDEFRELPPIPVIRSPMVDLADHSLCAASNAVRSLAHQIKEIEAQLDNESAIAFWVTGGPSNQAFFPREVYAEDPDRIVFAGIDENAHPFVLIQHVSQLNIAVRVAKLAAEEERQPIGFHIAK